MLEPLDDNNLRDHLSTFADGELDAHQAAAVWAYLADHAGGPAAMRWLAEQKQLAMAARRTTQVAAPDDLRERIHSLIATDHEPANPPAASTPMRISLTSPWPRRIGYALALAAAMALGVTVTNYSEKPARPADAVVPVNFVVMAGRVHGECARLPEAMHNARFAEADPRLAELVKADTHGTDAAGVPDLTSIGFHFVGAGPCPAQRQSTTHLLYRSDRPGGLAAISLFVQADTGQYPQLRADHVYRVSSPTSPFPMLVWRAGRVIYFLLADDEKTESRALEKIHPTPADAIVNAVG